MDCIGPLDPPSAQGHKYCLCIVDSCTRWPSVSLLKSLTAKAVCDSLLDLFVNDGVPKVIASDCGTNSTSPSCPIGGPKKSWSGESGTGASLAQPVEDYLLDLRSKLSEAAEFAQSHTDAAQQSYAAHYNPRARQKIFQDGDQITVLASENSGKMGNRWLGPGTVVKAKSPYSYLVIWVMAMYAICMPTKCVISSLEYKVAVLLLNVTPNW